jgi:hypothetical protein
MMAWSSAVLPIHACTMFHIAPVHNQNPFSHLQVAAHLHFLPESFNSQLVLCCAFRPAAPHHFQHPQGLMSVLDEEAYGDLESFTERFGDERPSLEQIRALQAALAPVLLRRMKEDVEDLPEKEEVVIWVELTQEQRR